MELWQNIPLFLIVVPLFCASLTAALPEKPARCAALTVLALSACASLYFFVKMLGYGEAFRYKLGEFPAPWGNELRAGPLEALMGLFLTVNMLLGVLGGLPRLLEQVAPRRRAPLCAVLLLMSAALMALTYTNDLFSAYVFIEIMTLAGCVLIVCRGAGHALVAGARYMIMNLLGSGLILLGIALLYDLTGHLLMQDIRAAVKLLIVTGDYHKPLTLCVSLIFAGLCVKGALFPFHTWIPDAYGASTPAAAVLLSSVINKAYIFLLLKIILRVFTMEFIAQSGILTVLSVFAMSGIVLGSLRAVMERDVRRMVAYSSVAQVGYIFLGLSMGTQAGLTAAIYHMLVHGLAKAMLFLSTDSLRAVSGGGKTFRDLRGSGSRDALAGVCFTVGALCMVGVPPLGGFVTKINLASAALQKGGAWTAPILAVLAISTTLNVWYFLKTVLTLYRPAPEDLSYPKAGKRAPLKWISAFAYLTGNFALALCASPALDVIETGLKLFK